MDNKELEEKIKQLDFLASNLESQIYSLKSEINILKIKKEQLMREQSEQANDINNVSNPAYRQARYSSGQYNVNNNNLNQNVNLTTNQTPTMNQALSLNQNPSLNQNQNLNQNPGLNQNVYGYGNPINVVNSGKSKDFEDWFGKNMMSVIASVLIFISIIIFSTVFYPNLTDEIKVASMFIFSFGLEAFGYFGVKKNNKDGFKLAIMACGVGCIFVSLLVTRIHFEMITDGILLVGVLLWAIVVMYLSRYANTLFVVIGQIGVFITISVGVNRIIELSDELTDGNIIYALVIMFILGQIILFFAGKTIKYSVLVNYIGASLGSIILFFNFNGFELALLKAFESKQQLVDLLLLIGIVALLAFIMINNKDELVNINSIFVCINSVELILFILGLMPNDIDVLVVCLIIAICITGLLMIYTYRYNKHKSVYSVVVVLLCVESIVALGIINELWSLALISLCILLYAYKGFVRDDKTFQWITVWSPFAYCINMGSYPGTTLLFVIIICFAVPYFMYKYKKTYRQIYKIILYVEFLYFFAVLFEIFGKKVDITRVYLSLIKYIIVSVASVFAMKTDYAKSFIDGSDETGFRNTAFAINAIIMFSGLTHILRYNDNPLVHIMYVLVVLTLYSVNSVSLFYEYESRWVHAYVGFKYTVLLMVILSSFNAPDIVISLACILFASLCIIFGFKIYKKGLRIYGLWLSMIFVFKLILVDLAIDDAISKAVGFLAAGLICFAISALYNYAKDKIG